MSSSRFATRASFVANRWSVAQSGGSITSHVRANRRSFPAARMNGRSLAWKDWYGTMFGCAVPIGPGTTPPIRWLAAWFTIAATLASNSATLTCRPRPVASRSRSAARMPIAAYRPVITSSSATPAFVGSPSRSPVTLISPESACTMMS